MAWTTPRTWTDDEVITADMLNAQIRDNLMHCAPSIVQGTGGYPVSSGENQLSFRSTHRVVMEEAGTRSSTSYGDLSSPASEGPTLTLTTGSKCLIIFGCDGRNDTAGASFFASLRVEGATSISPDDDWAIRVQTGANKRTQASQFMLFETLTPGENTFEMVYKIGGSGTATILRRRMMAFPF